MAEVIGLNQRTDRPIGCHAWKVTPGAGELTGTADIPLDTLPVGTVIFDCRVVCLTGDTGATSAALDVEVGSSTIYDTGADSLGVAGAFIAPSASGITSANTALLSGEQVVNCEITYSGTATVAPVFIVEVLCGRLEY